MARPTPVLPRRRLDDRAARAGAARRARRRRSSRAPGGPSTSRRGWWSPAWPRGSGAGGGSAATRPSLTRGVFADQVEHGLGDRGRRPVVLAHALTLGGGAEAVACRDGGELRQRRGGLVIARSGSSGGRARPAVGCRRSCCRRRPADGDRPTGRRPPVAHPVATLDAVAPGAPPAAHRLPASAGRRHGGPPRTCWPSRRTRRSPTRRAPSPCRRRGRTWGATRSASGASTAVPRLSPTRSRWIVPARPGAARARAGRCPASTPSGCCCCGPRAACRPRSGPSAPRAGWPHTRRGLRPIGRKSSWRGWRPVAPAAAGGSAERDRRRRSRPASNGPTNGRPGYGPGLHELDRWLADQVRRGLTAPSGHGRDGWDGVAAPARRRPGPALANRVRRIDRARRMPGRDGLGAVLGRDGQPTRPGECAGPAR